MRSDVLAFDTSAPAARPGPAPRRISIFGATGSIGESTVDLVLRAGGPAAYHTVAVTGARNIARLAEIAIALRAEVAVTADPAGLAALRAALAGTGIEAAAGEAALVEAACRPADWIMSGIVGFAGLAPGLAALAQGTTLALANKESLVTAGPLLLETAARHGARILPVDSEHSAVFQALVGEEMTAVERVIITASGGAFRDWPLDRLAGASVAEASSHPNWDMGQRITIDSASMFNKALEVIETREYFGFEPAQIEVLVHPESMVHALVGFRDGALMAHLGAPDMRHAIGYALNWPDRADLPVARLDLAAIGRLSFAAPDPARYPALALAREVMAIRGAAGAVFNAAKEAALDGFIEGRVRFTGMATVVERVLARMSAGSGLGNVAFSLDNLSEADREARALAREEIAARADV
ncbi:1-deoxy-D-xylulose-5-phosphate reductoisomerase [Frigidibacter sp. MR17.24]|uniref:1-deoxy-D-xylulose-5-phosphate reductoisomerase n=1 Tax=Frigidibacter sp. MR17.24 TaxID=3127345 RepID=UPI0030130482